MIEIFLRFKAYKINDPNDWTQLKKLRDIVNSEFRLAKQAYYQNSFNQYTGDSRKTWQTINELASSKSGKTAVTSLKVNGVSITNPTELSKEFNNHFATIGSELSRNIDSPDGDAQMHSVNKVFSLLNKLNKSKAAGLGKISARLTRECADLIGIHICDIFNQSISLGIFPDDWKCARGTPLFKQGDRDDLYNYRPISVISVVAKVFERIVFDKFYAYLEEPKIICKYQSGFRAIHSTVTALLEATGTWAYKIHCGKINVVVFLDLKKAFDTVHHEILLSKLNLYDINGIAHQWLQSYLEDRTQMCSINGLLSGSCSLSCGVPQGTIFGPLLFLLYITDLPNCLSNCEHRMYADNTHLTYTSNNIHNIQTSLNEDLENVHNWLRANKLTLNMTKTEFMLIRSRQRLSTVTVSQTLAINDFRVS